MEKRVLGRTGLEVTRIGFGGIPIQRLGMDEAVGVLRRALELGCGLIDSARGYSDSEEKIGAALRGRPERPVVATKTVSRDCDGARRDVDISLGNLGLESIDIYMLHNVTSIELLDQVMGDGGAEKGLEKARAEGLIGHIGISSHKTFVLEAAIEREAFGVIEFPFSAIEGQFLPVGEQAASRGVGTIAMKPLAGGALTSAPAAIRFVLGHPVDCVIPGMQSLAEVEADLRASGPLSEEEREALNAEVQEWDGRFCRRCEYCLEVCPSNIDVTRVLIFASYAQRYGLSDWARQRYATMPVMADACEECGKCEERCPYSLPVREMLKEAHEALAG
ncbi:MAG: aldo/keto reductase [Candidatus Brocadiia bacterium]|nr:aldo/keto reductase [Candidatus Brocadiia bacterium]